MTNPTETYRRKKPIRGNLTVVYKSGHKIVATNTMEGVSANEILRELVRIGQSTGFVTQDKRRLPYGSVVCFWAYEGQEPAEQWELSIR